MPDFDTRGPQGTNEPSKLRIPSISNRLRNLLIATWPRIGSIANRVRSLLIANRFRTLLVSGGILMLVVTVPVGLSVYSSGGMVARQHKGADVNSNPQTGGC